MGKITLPVRHYINNSEGVIWAGYMTKMLNKQVLSFDVHMRQCGSMYVGGLFWQTLLHAVIKAVDRPHAPSYALLMVWAALANAIPVG